MRRPWWERLLSSNVKAEDSAARRKKNTNHCGHVFSRDHETEAQRVAERQENSGRPESNVQNETDSGPHSDQTAELPREPCTASR